MLAFTGLRFGEASALTAGDVDFAAQRIHVRRAHAEVNGKIVEGPPKSGRARAVPLPPFTAAELTALTAGRAPSAMLFTSARGGVIRLTTWRRRVCYPAIDACNSARKNSRLPAFPDVTPHDLRHTAASLAVNSGANVEVLQRIMGHSSAALTLDVYADLYEDDLDMVAARMSALYEGDQGTPALAPACQDA